jgi:nucleoid-associated protein YgaU
MGIFDFIKNAGHKVIKHEDKTEDSVEVVRRHLAAHGVSTKDVTIMVDGDKVTLMGYVPSLDVKEKTVLLAGNIEGIAKVDDRLHVGVRPGQATPVATTAHPAGSTLGTGTGKVNMAPNETSGAPAWQSRTYTVEKGDTLSAISKKFYGDASDYKMIFEANKPMLSDPDKIYPGQVLRIPAQHPGA